MELFITYFWYYFPYTLQAIALLIVAIISIVLRSFGRQWLNQLTERLEKPPVSRVTTWLVSVVTVVRRSLLPLGVWLCLYVFAGIFGELGRPNTTLIWLLPVAGFWFGYRFVSAILTVRLVRNHADVWIKQVFRPVFFLILILYVLGLLDNVLTFGIPLQETHITIGTLLTGTGVLLLFFAVSQTVRRYLRDSFLPSAGITPALGQAISAITAYFIGVLGLLAALDTVGLDVTAITVIAGGLSVGIGFGLQEIVNNFLSGFILLFERSISPGDVLRLGEHVGMVESVGFRSISLRTRNNVELIVPNSRFLTDIVTNYTRSDMKIRTSIRIGVSYSANPREVEEALLEAANIPSVLKTPAPEVEFIDFGDNSLIFDLEVWTIEPFYMDGLSSKLRYRIWEELNTRDIHIPYPQRDIHIRSFPDKETTSPT